jgi:hypothetical protein
VIDEYSLRLDGWARFSDDRRLRFRLARMLTPAFRIAIVDGRVMGLPQDAVQDTSYMEATTIELVRVCFLMLNPSSADAFKLDPTVQKCVKFALRWGAQVIEVVNLFALRSPHPQDLYAIHDPSDGDNVTPPAAWSRGAGIENDDAILSACKGATRVIASWGNHGSLGGRDLIVLDMLKLSGIKLEHLGLTQGGAPLHPLARGKAFIPLDREPIAWAA